MSLSVPLKFGQQRITAIADPAVATNFVYTPSTRLIEQLISIIFRYIADANAANRSPVFNVTDSSGIIMKFGTNQGQTASQDFNYSLTEAAGNFENGNLTPNYSQIEIPRNLIIPLDGTIASAFSNIQAGDQISAITVVTRVWQRT